MPDEILTLQEVAPLRKVAEDCPHRQANCRHLRSVANGDQAGRYWSLLWE
jgi:hypothetical protein